MRLLMTASASVECDVGYATVNVTREYAQTILKRAKAFLAAKNEDRDAYEHYFWDSGALSRGCAFLRFPGTEPEDNEDGDDDDDVFSAEFDDSDRWVRTQLDDQDLSRYLSRTECDQMVIREDGVTWTAVWKHTDAWVCTEVIPYHVIEEALGEGV